MGCDVQNLAVAFPQAENDQKQKGNQLTECGHDLQVSCLLDADTVHENDKGDSRKPNDGNIVIRNAEEQAED